MKSKNKLLITLLIVIIICGAMFQIYRLTEPKVIDQAIKTPDPFVSLLKESIELNLSNNTQKIIMSDVTPFSWKKMYIVEPYTSYSEIKKRVGDTWDNKCYNQIIVSDSYTLLLFMSDNEVVYCTDFPRADGIFIIPDSKYLEGISKQEAIFTITKEKQLVRLFLVDSD